LEGDQPRPENLPLSGEMVGRPNEFLIPGSIGDGLLSRGIAFIGETAAAGFGSCIVGVVFFKPKNPDFSRVGEGTGGGPMSEVDRFLF